MMLLASCLPNHKIRATHNNNKVNLFIARHIQAAGGREALLSLKSISRMGHIEFFNDPKNGPHGKFRYRTDIIYPHKLREEIVKESILIDRGTDDSNYWEWNGAAYRQIVNQKQQESMNKTAEQANREILWLTDDIPHLSVSEQAPAWADNDNCLEGIKDESIVYLCFNPKTGLLSAKGSNAEYRIYSDYKRTNSIMLPYRLTHFQHSKKIYEVVLQHVEVNPVIDPRRFEMPSHN